MTDPTTPADRPGDDEETADPGGDSDPRTDEGFDPPDDARRDRVPPP